MDPSDGRRVTRSHTRKLTETSEAHMQDGQISGDLEKDATSSSAVVPGVDAEQRSLERNDDKHTTSEGNPSLFDNMPERPHSSRPPNEYVVVRRTDSGKITGVANAKLERQLTPREFNECCRLYRDGAGNYYPPPLAWDRIKVPEFESENGKALDESERSARRKDYKVEVWQRAHAAMKITGTQIFFDVHKDAVDRSGRLRPEHRYVETQYGRREVVKSYTHKFQAGSLLPDMMVITAAHDIHFVFRSAGDTFKGRKFEDFEREMKETYGEPIEIKLKSKSGIMHDSKYLESWERGSADIRFAEFAGEVRTHNSELPRATVNFGRQTDEHGGTTLDHHLSVEFLFASQPNSPWAQALKRGELWDRVQVLARDGNGYMSPQRLQYSDPAYFVSLMDGVGLPKEMGQQRYADRIKFEEFEAKAPVIVAKGPELRDARALEREADVADPTRVLIANRNAAGQRTGTYTILAEYERTNRELPADVAKVMGVDQDTYSRNFVPPNPARRPIYDSRLREREGSNIAI